MRLLYCATFAVALLLAPAASAATITVNTLQDEANSNGNCSLREAILAANGDTAVDACTAGSGDDDIVFLPAILGGTVTLTQQAFAITSNVNIDGTYLLGQITLDGADTYRVFDVQSGALALTDLQVDNGRAASGAGVYVRSGASLDADNVMFSANTATGDDATQGGAAVYNEGGTATFDGCTFDSNVAVGMSGSGGAILSNGGALVVDGGLFQDNTANRAGGAIEITGDASTDIEDADFASNTAGSNPGNGGALHITGASSATISGGTVSGNTAAREGGGFWNGAGTMTLDEVDFTGNTAGGPAADDGGGALFNNGGTMQVTDGTILDNVASGALGSGGGILTLGGSLEVTGTEIRGNRANRAGAGVESAGAGTLLTDVTVDDNDIPAATAMPGNGGGVHAGGGTLVVSGGTYSNNDATEGGALWANGTLTVQDGTEITGNTGRGDDAENGGGGIYVESGGMAQISDAEIMDNAATGTSGSGGGVLVASGASATITNSTIADNQANRAGAGIEVAGGTLDLVEVTVDGNVIPAATAMPGNGGGLHAGGGVVRVFGGLFSDNEATEGGGLWSNGQLIIGDEDDSELVATIRANIGRGADASNGGGGVYLESGADARIFNAQIVDNVASGTAGSGGGILIADGSTLVIEGGSVSANSANRAGAGIEIADDPMTDDMTDMVMDWVMVDGNAIVTAAPGNGGGIHIGGAGQAIVRGSTFSNNTAREGAGVWVAGAGRFDIANSTVSGNAATEDGGGLYDNGGDSSATFLLESVTVVSNTAGGNGGGLLSQSSDGSTYTLANTVLADNEASDGADCFGTFVSGDYNLVETLDGCTLGGDTANTITGQDPQLGPLADNGGQTMTHLPDTGSPLVDNGRSAFDVDQRDFDRTVGQDDIGAIERGAVVDDEEAPTASALTMRPASPNPARGETTLAFTVAEAGEARVEVYNVLGQRVMVAFDGAASADGESVRLDVSGLAPGVYVVRLQSGNAQATQRITVVR